MDGMFITSYNNKDIIESIMFKIMANSEIKIKDYGMDLLNGYDEKIVKEEIENIYGDVKIDFEKDLKDSNTFTYNKENKAILVSSSDREDQITKTLMFDSKTENDKILLYYYLISAEFIPQESSNYDESKVQILLSTKETFELDNIREKDFQKIQNSKIELNISKEDFDNDNYSKVFSEYSSKLPILKYTMTKKWQRYIITNVEFINK